MFIVKTLFCQSQIGIEQSSPSLITIQNVYKTLFCGTNTRNLHLKISIKGQLMLGLKQNLYIDLYTN